MTINFTLDINSVSNLIHGSGPIVIVDDDPSQITLIEICYKKAGRDNELICKFGHEDFLSYMNDVKLGKSSMPELVLLDLNLPSVNGFDILKLIKDDIELSGKPNIVILSTSDSSSDIEKAKILKAEGFISKPTSVQEYLSLFSRN